MDLVSSAADIENESQSLEGLLDCTSNDEVFGFSELPKSFEQIYDQHALGVKRTALNVKLKNMLVDIGINVREGWELEDIVEDDDSVAAHFQGGPCVTGAFLIGGDGIKAASRRILLSKQGLAEEGHHSADLLR